ncbi:20124_t:CDS:2 [Funneliformis geosporum]|nr:20124_t:CDS:2 [Funneliformis geosporum]
MNPTTVVAKPSTATAGLTKEPSKTGTGACSIIIWPMVDDYKFTKDERIKRLYYRYALQVPIYHAKIMMIGIWIMFYTSIRWALRNDNFVKDIETSILEKDVNRYIVPFDMVRKESNLLYLVYFGNIAETILLSYVTYEYCENSLSFCFKYVIFFDVFVILAIIGLIILALSTWNTYKCHRNFGNNLGFYLNYEPCPREFEYGNKRNKLAIYNKSNDIEIPVSDD